VYVCSQKSICIYKGIIECVSSIIVFLKPNQILGVSRQLPEAAWGALPEQFGAQFLLLLPTAKHMMYDIWYMMLLMSLWMEQLDKEAFKGSSPRAWSIYQPMHPFFFFSFFPPPMYGRQQKWFTMSVVIFMKLRKLRCLTCKHQTQEKRWFKRKDHSRTF
jgi:hypothetical protein